MLVSGRRDFGCLGLPTWTAKSNARDCDLRRFSFNLLKASPKGKAIHSPDPSPCCVAVCGSTGKVGAILGQLFGEDKFPRLLSMEVVTRRLSSITQQLAENGKGV